MASPNASTGDCNLISGNQTGIYFSSATDAVALGNFIGTNLDRAGGFERHGSTTRERRRSSAARSPVQVTSSPETAASVRMLTSTPGSTRETGSA